MFSSKQTHMFDYFICYHLESGCHVTRPNQGLSLGRGRAWERGWRLRLRLRHLHSHLEICEARANASAKCA